MASQGAAVYLSIEDGGMITSTYALSGVLLAVPAGCL